MGNCEQQCNRRNNKVPHSLTCRMYNRPLPPIYRPYVFHSIAVFRYTIRDGTDYVFGSFRIIEQISVVRETVFCSMKSVKIIRRPKNVNICMKKTVYAVRYSYFA